MSDIESKCLDVALQALRAIKDAKTFKDSTGDKVILSTWKDFAEATIKQIESIKK